MTRRSSEIAWPVNFASQAGLNSPRWCPRPRGEAFWEPTLGALGTHRCPRPREDASV